MNVYGTLVSALVDTAMAESHRAGPVPPLSVVQGDFLAQLLEMGFARRKRPRRDRQPFWSAARSIEEEILGGAVEVGGLPGVTHPHFTYRPHGWKTGLPLTQTSSMVSELAPLVLYLRHALAPGDLLIWSRTARATGAWTWRCSSTGMCACSNSRCWRWRRTPVPERITPQMQVRGAANYRRRLRRVGSSIPSCAQKPRPRSKPSVVSAPSNSRTSPVSSWR